MKSIENKQDYNAVDLLAKEIAKAADFNANKYEYDKTFISLIYKNSTGVSDKLTDDEKTELDKLGECDEFWYCVRINGIFYKLECKDTNIAIDTEVKVTVPCNNWNKMFINFKKGSINVSPITNFTAICDMETNIVTLTWDYIPVNKSSYSIATFCVMRDPFNNWDNLIDNEFVGYANYDYNTPFNSDGKTKTATYVDKIPDDYTNDYTRYKVCTRIDQNYYYTSDIVTVYINKNLPLYGKVTNWLYRDGDEFLDTTGGWKYYRNDLLYLTKISGYREQSRLRRKNTLKIFDNGEQRNEKFLWSPITTSENKNIWGWNEIYSFLPVSTVGGVGIGSIEYNKPQRLCIEITNHYAVDINQNMFCRVIFCPYNLNYEWYNHFGNFYANKMSHWLRYIYDSNNHKIENPNINNIDFILLDEVNCFNNICNKKIFKANINLPYSSPYFVAGHIVFLTYVPYTDGNVKKIDLDIHKVWLENQE